MKTFLRCYPGFAATCLMRLAVALACAFVLPACGGGGDDSTPPPTVITLLNDDFSSGNLANWTVHSEDVEVIPGGDPGPSMAMDASVNGLASARTKINVNFSAPLIFTILVDAGNSTFTDNNGTISIVNNVAPATSNTYVSFTDTSATFSISGMTKTVPLTMGPGSFTWRRFGFRFNVNLGVATWTLDGVNQHTIPYSVAEAHVYLTEQGGGLTLFDNVSITASSGP